MHRRSEEKVGRGLLPRNYCRSQTAAVAAVVRAPTPHSVPAASSAAQHNHRPIATTRSESLFLGSLLAASKEENTMRPEATAAPQTAVRPSVRPLTFLCHQRIARRCRRRRPRLNAMRCETTVEVSEGVGHGKGKRGELKIEIEIQSITSVDWSLVPNKQANLRQGPCRPPSWPETDCDRRRHCHCRGVSL
jgi:hypothetical protein